MCLCSVRDSPERANQKIAKFESICEWCGFTGCESQAHNVIAGIVARRFAAKASRRLGTHPAAAASAHTLCPAPDNKALRAAMPCARRPGARLEQLAEQANKATSAVRRRGPER